MTRDYRKEYLSYHAKPEQKKNRAERNAARRELTREGKVHKGDRLDVNHKKMLKDGGSNKRSNLNVQTQHKNRGWRRDG